MNSSKRKKGIRGNFLAGSISIFQEEERIKRFYIFNGEEVAEAKTGESLLKHVILESIEQKDLPVFGVYGLIRLFIPLRKEIQKLKSVFSFEVLAKNSYNLLTITIKKGNKNVLKLMEVSELFQAEMFEIAERLNVNYLDKTPQQQSVFDSVLIYKYLKKLLAESTFLNENQLGKSLFTQTSTARLENRFYFDKEINGVNPYQRYLTFCNAEQNPKTIKDSVNIFDYIYTQSAVNRGGLHFNSLKNAFELHENAHYLDADSMHHACINAHYSPEKFEEITNFDQVQELADYIVKMPLAEVLTKFYKPFNVAFNALVYFEGLELKKGSIFDEHSIGILSESKFSKFINYQASESIEVKLNNLKEYGYTDSVEYPIFAGSKLLSCSSCFLWLTEIELFNISQVYDFSEMKIIQGYYTTKFTKAPDYILLSSCRGYQLKKQVKRITKEYKPGEPYTQNLDGLPGWFASKLKAGTLTAQELEQFYIYDIKARFNSLYGICATDENKPNYFIDENMDILAEDLPDPENFKPKSNPKTNLNFGLRIVGYSRLHLIAAILLLAENKKFNLISGDTDSIIFNGITERDALVLLKPLHQKLKYSIDLCTNRIKKYYPGYFYSMREVGKFEIERAGFSVMCTWLKTRAELDQENNLKLFISGIAERETGASLTDFIHDFAKNIGYEKALLFALGNNKTYSTDIVLNYQYNELPEVDTGAGVRLELAEYTIGDLTTKQNRNTFKYLINKEKFAGIEEFYNFYISYNKDLNKYEIKEEMSV